MQFVTLILSATFGILSLAFGANASPIMATDNTLEDRTAWMFQFCDDTNLGGKCVRVADDHNLNICIDHHDIAEVKSIKTFPHFDCWAYTDSKCQDNPTRYLPGTYNNPHSFNTWRCYTGSGGSA